ncbi:putative UDP-glucuronate:xylan alpha-glucuronosyltransferase 5 [Phtheirospermum japonicum]|uniref:Hexosyltransferase n=1 Tax=Phtheirospermum japonicum TaxID=374723 RepID=A0A830BFQ1_9LAMI|nr:putative UDP-glucuronate:xylan alpha-glucuronosyltransferase 5 [Phtheirospermum japonicum]
MPRFEDYQDLDVVVASVDRCGDGESKNVFRLQVNLVVANLLVRSGRKDDRPVYAVFVGGCSPMWEIFRCDDLLWNEGNAWVYKPELTRIQKLMLMPFGPCQFVPPFSHFGDQDLWTRLNHITTQFNHQHPKDAYVTVLHTSEDYVCGAIVLAQSILQSNTTKDLILLADDNISPPSLEALRAAGWQTKRIERIRSPYSKQNTYNEWNYSKLRIWQLTQYEKLIFIDADLLVNKNIDQFFVYPQLTAAGNYQKHFFNSGLMLVEPSRCTFETLMEKMMVVESYNGGDQGFLNEMYAWWHRLPALTNYLKVFVDVNDHLHYVNKKDVFAVHYTGLKPWKCEDEESDCNWDVLKFHRYASNSAHKMWWKVYKSMPEDLRDYCSLYRGKNNETYRSPNEVRDIPVVNKGL